MLTRPIPRTGEPLPVIGLGTWAVRGPLDEVLRRHLAAGARLIDSSPMYGDAERLIGDGLAAIGAIGKPFLATKVWISGKQAGIAQMTQSMRLMRATSIDLMQVHNLLDVDTHLPVLREWKAAGKIRYLGVTHYQHSQLPAIERLMRGEQLDFIQIPYSIVDRAVEQRVLPAARDTGTAVLVMQPFGTGSLFSRVRGKRLPGCAAELGCTSWAQVFLKFILGHPAVTCPLPATSDPAHADDNLRAGDGPLPDERQRAELAAAV